MSRRCHNSTQTLPGSLERLVLGVGVEARRDRGVGMPQPIGDDRQRHAAQVQRGAASDGRHVAESGARQAEEAFSVVGFVQMLN